jgi:catechol 2,3-dioxygenase-like lactoylglutathione lyase family enzyme
MSEARVNKLRYVAVAVPDFASEHDFITATWGLKEVGKDGDVAYFAAESSSQPYVYRLRKADEKRLDLISLGVENRVAVDQLAKRLASAGVKLIGEPQKLDEPGGGYGFRFFDPDGRTVELSSDFSERETRELKHGESIPASLSHVVMHTSDVKKTVAFYEQQLGFRVSDWLGDFFCFIRCNEWHHSLAFLPGPPALNHTAFAMKDLNEMMRGVGRLMKSKATLSWGPGRHTAGDNVFAYFVVPSGNVLEYTAEVERVDEATWKPHVYAPSPEIMDQWGTGVLGGGPEKMGRPTLDPGLFKAPPR